MLNNFALLRHTPHQQALGQAINNNVKQFFRTFCIASNWFWEKKNCIYWQYLFFARMIYILL
jgi:hypothetical protein